jgi:hypothetical protein
MNITNEAVTALAAILVEDGAYGVPWGDASDDDRAEAMSKARRYLNVAAPHLIAEAWDEGEHAGYLNRGAEEFGLRRPNPYRSVGAGE